MSGKFWLNDEQWAAIEPFIRGTSLARGASMTGG